MEYEGSTRQSSQQALYYCPIDNPIPSNREFGSSEKAKSHMLGTCIDEYDPAANAMPDSSHDTYHANRDTMVFVTEECINDTKFLLENAVDKNLLCSEIP